MRTSEINYSDIGDYLSREQKLELVDRSDLTSIQWQQITPNADGDWINQRNTAFATFTPMGEKAKGTSGVAIFRNYSVGLATSRDAWSYSFSRDRLTRQMGDAIAFYNEQRSEFAALGKDKLGVDDFISQDPTRVSWSRGLKGLLGRGVPIEFRPDSVSLSAYRPFTREFAYVDRQMAETVSQLPSIFPSPEHPNMGIMVTGVSSHYDFTPFITDLVPDLHLLDTGQFFPRYTYRARDTGTGADMFSDDGAGSYDRIDNITDAALTDFRKQTGADVSKDDIFYYVYAVLHEPTYRATFASDLKKMLPRIPKVSTVSDFNAYVVAGRRLSDVHIGYESVEPWPVTETTSAPLGVADDLYRVQKMTFGAKKDRSRVIYNSFITLSDIPAEAHDYLLGSRSAIEWIMERYQVKTDKASGIVNDPNDWAAEVGDPRYILDLLKRIVTVSIETMKIVNSLPALDL